MRRLGLEALGFELDPNACATRRAVGLPTVEGDVRSADPMALEHQLEGLIASPPCQTFSMAGKGAGRAALERLRSALATGWWYGLPGDDEASMDNGNYRWRFQSDNRPNTATRGLDEPAPTILGNGQRGAHAQWVHDRPATTVNGDPRISRPGRHDPEESGSQQRDAIRVSLEEAAVLQTFPADYPWQGNKGQTFQQVGNAVPPLLAEAVLSALIGELA